MNFGKEARYGDTPLATHPERTGDLPRTDKAVGSGNADPELLRLTFRTSR